MLKTFDSWSSNISNFGSYSTDLPCCLCHSLKQSSSPAEADVDAAIANTTQILHAECFLQQPYPILSSALGPVLDIMSFMDSS
jgi:hypothetical protein